MIKGCLNSNCPSNKNHTKYSDNKFKYCPECGSLLEHVCKNCYKKLDDDNEKYCKHCLEERDEKKAQRNEKLKKAGGTLLAAAVTVSTVAASIFNKKK